MLPFLLTGRLLQGLQRRGEERNGMTLEITDIVASGILTVFVNVCAHRIRFVEFVDGFLGIILLIGLDLFLYIVFLYIDDVIEALLPVLALLSTSKTTKLHR